MAHLYHYTSIEALLSIMKTGKFRFTDFRYLNDSSEFQLYLDLFRNFVKAVDQKLSQIPFDPNQDYGGEHIYAENYFDSLQKSIDVVEFLGVACFSKNPNDLSQWRAYTPLGTGIALEFDRSGLDKFAKNNELELVECRYDSEEIGLNVDDWVEQLTFNRRTDYPEVMADEDLVQQTSLASSFKHKSFSVENECRLITQPLGQRWIPGSWIEYPIEYRPGKYSAIPFIEVDGILKALRGVIIGPTREPKLSQRAIEFAANSKELSIRVRYCDIPFRSL